MYIKEPFPEMNSHLVLKDINGVGIVVEPVDPRSPHIVFRLHPELHEQLRAQEIMNQPGPSLRTAQLTRPSLQQHNYMQQSMGSQRLHSQIPYHPQAQNYSMRTQAQQYSTQTPQAQHYSMKTPQAQHYSMQIPQAQQYSTQTPQAQQYSTQTPQAQQYSMQTPQAQNYSMQTPQPRSYQMIPQTQGLQPSQLVNSFVIPPPQQYRVPDHSMVPPSQLLKHNCPPQVQTNTWIHQTEPQAHPMSHQPTTFMSQQIPNELLQITSVEKSQANTLIDPQTTQYDVEQPMTIAQALAQIAVANGAGFPPLLNMSEKLIQQSHYN